MGMQPPMRPRRRNSLISVLLGNLIDRNLPGRAHNYIFQCGLASLSLFLILLAEDAVFRAAIVVAVTTVTITDDDISEVITTRLQAAIGSGGRAVVEVYVDNIKNPSTGSTSTAIAGGVRSFSGKVTFSSSSIQILGVQDAAGFAGTAFSTSTGQATFSATASAQTSTTSPILVAKLIVILTGSKNATTTLTLDSLSIVASTTGVTISQDSSAKATDTYQRGNTRADSTTVNIFDALFAAQCTVGSRSFGTDSPKSQCHPINATTARHDGASGDKISIFDALFIAQAVVGTKDEFFK